MISSIKVALACIVGLASGISAFNLVGLPQITSEHGAAIILGALIITIITNTKLSLLVIVGMIFSFSLSTQLSLLVGIPLIVGLSISVVLYVALVDIIDKKIN
jgi:hypothetical protein